MVFVFSGQYAIPPFHGKLLKALPYTVHLPTTAFEGIGTLGSHVAVPGTPYAGLEISVVSIA
jgi:hypothetical protein